MARNMADARRRTTCCWWTNGRLDGVPGLSLRPIRHCRPRTGRAVAAQGRRLPRPGIRALKQFTHNAPGVLLAPQQNAPQSIKRIPHPSPGSHGTNRPVREHPPQRPSRLRGRWLHRHRHARRGPAAGRAARRPEGRAGGGHPFSHPPGRQPAVRQPRPARRGLLLHRHQPGRSGHGHAARHPGVQRPFSNTRSVAELVLGEAILLLRRIPEKNARVHLGHWDKSASGAFETRGKTLGIVGYGNIGSQISTLAEGLGMRVVFHDVEAKLPLGARRRLAERAAGTIRRGHAARAGWQVHREHHERRDHRPHASRVHPDQRLARRRGRHRRAAPGTEVRPSGRRRWTCSPPNPRVRTNRWTAR